MTNWELPLVLFTVVSQAAVGAIIFSAVLESQVAPENHGTRRGLRMAGAMAFPLLLVALVFSIFHLGQPFAAFRALGNFGTSWLSREIWFFLILTVLTAVYSYYCYVNQNEPFRKAMGYLAGVVGLMGVVSSAMVYALPARAAWTPAGNILAFLGTTALLGSLVVAVGVRRFTADGGENDMAMRASGWAAVVGALLTVVSLVVVGAMGGTDPAVMKSVGLMLSSGLFWVQLLLGLMLPFAVAAAMIVKAREVTVRAAALGLGAALLGGLAGRVLFYVSALGPSLWG